VADPSFCRFFYSFEISKLPVVYQGATESAITQSGTTFNFLYMNELPNLTQKQTVTVTATSYQLPLNPATNVPIESTASFDLTFLDPCLNKEYISITTSVSENT